MASYPIDQNPITIAPAAPDAGTVIVLAPRGTPVVAPEAGELAYVGDGSADPFKAEGPGVVVLWGRRSNALHVLGGLDRGYVDVLRGAGLWGWQGGAVDRGTIFAVRDAVFGAPARPRVQIDEGRQLGFVGPANLRWTMVNSAAAPTSPLAWATRNGLPAVRVAAPAEPMQPAPASTAEGGSGAALLLLLLLAFKGD